MKKLLLLLVFVLGITTARADYGYMTLCEMIQEAHYGALGTIVKIDNNYFYLKVEKYILNSLEMDTLPIVKFENWPCAQRYAEYAVGQKEIVFFRKSNYVIDDYELFGFGAGDEYELPIFNDTVKYQRSYGKLDNHNLYDFLNAINDYDKLNKDTKSTSKEIDTKGIDAFAQKSNLHKLIIKCRAAEKEEDFEIPDKGIIMNLERNYLYEDYENKIFISNLTGDSIYMTVDNAEVWKEEGYFVVKPKNGWTRRWLNVYSTKTKDEHDVLLNQIFEVIKLPTPTIYFGNSTNDSIYSWDAIPTVGYYLDDLHQDQYLKYKLLSYEYQIISNNTSETFKIKSERGTKDFHERIRDLKPGDKITMNNIWVLYPNNSVQQIKSRTVTVKRSVID
jgi:GldM C-terminal domain